MYLATHATRRQLLPRALLALLLTAASFAVFLESERIEVPTATVAALSERGAG